jgi:membrane-associated phospholipid phosphatase
VATVTAVLRLYNNRHWVSDVVAGACLVSLLQGLLTYFSGSQKNDIGKEFMHNALVPMCNDGTAGLALMHILQA